ncbi:hypothetical protein [Bradyrhizobium elkanii]|uniref:hypothetical protein n=1 Tax=Bradyrhizobium elkanii TaxID=29448 RepID=UPI001AE6C788|nr:hypothetical protein [Bradyrhizobium elkanii]MBP2434248.1 hypothetical protein [Bradyrhizobium elkanii]WLA88846.1 hypothetical protein QNJ96_27540 [Bradyrhizobium elkanii]
MPSLPVPTQTDAVIQNQTTGAVDFLKYQGTQIVASSLHDYGIGPAWKIVANGDFNGNGTQDLVAQNQTTGQLDFLYLDASANLVGSFMTSFGLPDVHGQGFFGTAAAGQNGPALISQLSDGRIDFLAFKFSGGSEIFSGSDLVEGTLGFPTLVGGGTQTVNSSMFSGQGTGFSGSVITQLSNGELDAVGFTGDIANGLFVSRTLLMPQTIGAFPVKVVNPDFSGGGQTTSSDVAGPAGTFGVQLLTQSNAGLGDVLYIDSGYGEPAANNTIGDLYASQTLTSIPGWNFVEGSFVAQELFPIV